jgi:hypothetical protein
LFHLLIFGLKSIVNTRTHSISLKINATTIVITGRCAIYDEERQRGPQITGSNLYSK